MFGKAKGLYYWILVTLILASSCSTSTKPTPSPPVSYPPWTKPYCVRGKCYFPLLSAEGYVEEGIASWYGPQFHGKKTSSGEIFNMNDMTAAHKTLPLGIYVKVTRLDNGRWIIVKVNDRGPFVGDRIIDLSKRAAEELGIIPNGTAKVRIEALQPATLIQYAQNQYRWVPEPVASPWRGLFEIQLAAFESRQNADRFRSSLARRHPDVGIEPYYFGGKMLYRVKLGKFDDLHKARAALEAIRSEFPDAFVIARDGGMK
ncbi:MAG: septal ring lytic transglycosylase RlpA family protein [Syntrophobacterales bacterium]|nr:septal ring lytic transglycosylase RlpA family protein [Syntrophobacterales bacterium]